MVVWIKMICIVCFVFWSFQAPLYAEAFSTQTWGRIAVDFDYRSLDEKDPDSTGGIQDSSESSLDATPDLAFGVDMTLFRRVKLNSFAYYQHRYLGSETSFYPSPFSRQKIYPDTLVQRALSVHLGLHVPVLSYLLLGIASEKQWVQTTWMKTQWDGSSYVEVLPWMGLLWNKANQTYLALILEQNINPEDDQRTYKVEPGLFSNPSFQLSHVYEFSQALRFAGALSHEKRIFEDFWYDQIENHLSLGLEWFLVPRFSIAVLLGGTQRDFFHPWKRNGPCGHELGPRTSDFYMYDAANCYRREAEEAIRLGLTWEIFKEFRLGTHFEWTTRHAREEEFANLRKGVNVAISWQTEKTLFSDPLRTFLPWAYKGHAF